MPTFRRAMVVEVLDERTGLQRLRVHMPDGSEAAAYCLTGLVGKVRVGDHVVCNTTAIDLGLGTGGAHVVHWNLRRNDFVSPGPDHIMKLRYTSLQFDAGTDELNHPDIPDHLDETPVVVCSVHSQLGIVAATIDALAPGTAVAYVMTDGAALPIALGDLVDDLKRRGMLCGTVTAGHAFGGDLEAVTVHSALCLARWVLEAEIVIVGMGPGVVGTGTQLGTTAIEVAPLLDAVAALGGEPVLCVRASDGDGRSRHQGVSHHTRTAASLTFSRPWVAPVPPEAADLPDVRTHMVGAPDVARILDERGLRITTMGRDHRADPLFFAASGAAAAVAVDLMGGPPPTTRR
ncbi:MAG: DUF3866 family protein [Microthrixaceae bacterium]